LKKSQAARIEQSEFGTLWVDVFRIVHAACGYEGIEEAAANVKPHPNEQMQRS
jgi:hypothetical protein